MQIYDSIVVGAGISGLFLSRRLEQAGQKILALEKSKGVGGRIATRRDVNANYDHGAQFYKLSIAEEKKIDLIGSLSNSVFTWFEESNFEYKCSAKGLNQIAKDIANRDKIIFEEKALKLREVLDPSNKFKIIEILCESGRTYFAKTCYITVPLPQALEILKKSNFVYPSELELIKYASALVGLFELDSESEKLKGFHYNQKINNELFSVSNQQAKKVSPKLAFTVVMQPNWSLEHFELPENEILNKMSYIFQDFLNTIDPSYSISKMQIKKWRYSHPLTVFEKPFLQLGKAKNIYLVGDAFGGPSIIGALKSAEGVPI